MTDVHKYLKGQLSAREMHALEKAALDDPFLADALEGLATPTALDQDLASLRTRLDERVAEKKTRLLLRPWMRIAAAVVLLAGLGLTAILTTSKNKLDNTKTASLPAPADDVTSGISAKPSVPAAAEPAATQTTPKPDREVVASSKAEKSTTPTRRQAPVALSRANNAKIQNVADSLQFSNSLAGAALKNEASIPTYSPAPNHPLLFAGQVRDVNNHPLAGVSLALEGKKVVTVTDYDGYFKLYVPPHDTVRKLTVEFAGYDEKFVALNDDNRLGNVITLRERQPSMQEVVVTGLGMKRKETMAAPPSDDGETLDSLWTKAAPTIGRVAYLDYLAAGKKSLGADSTIRGTVGISFTIDPNGQPANFKIEQSLAPVQDAGIIRLISDGSTWKLLRGKKARLLVSVSFP
jgi:outer membrane biosynthesis protein TonB